MNIFGGSLFSSGGSKLVGVDIGSSSIKIVTGKASKGVFLVDDFVAIPVPARTFDERGIHNAETLRGILNESLQHLGKSKPPVATALRGPGVLTKRIIISHFPKKEIPDQVRWEAEQVFPMDISTICVDHILLGEVKNLPGAPPGTPGWDLLLIGVRQDSLLPFEELFEGASCHLKSIDIDAFAVADVMDTLLGLSRDEVVALVDVGASGTRVSVRHQGNIVFIREFSLGGNAFTESIGQALGLSFEDAESLKIQDGAGIPQEAMEALQMSLQSWKNEIQQSEDVFIAQDANLLISRWLLLGGASQTPGLVEMLQDEHFGQKLYTVPASSLFRSDSKKVDPGVLALWAPRLFTSAGLSMRKA